MSKLGEEMAVQLEDAADSVRRQLTQAIAGVKYTNQEVK